MEDRQSRIAFKTVNEASEGKSTLEAKFKAARQEERVQMWKEHFKYLLGYFPKVTYKLIPKIINCQQDIKVGVFNQEEFSVVLSKIKNKKPSSLDEIYPEIWMTRTFDDVLLRFSNAVYKENTIDIWTKSCILLFAKTGGSWITKNNRGIRRL